jgi:hypothetical protein
MGVCAKNGEPRRLVALVNAGPLFSCCADTLLAARAALMGSIDLYRRSFDAFKDVSKSWQVL